MRSSASISAWFTFDDMIVSAWQVLVEDATVLARWQRVFQCVIVDEFQDVNMAQVELLDLLTVNHRNYMAVGDDDQTIYEWRGASPEFLLNFERRYGATRYQMTENFRSHAGVVVLANRCIANNPRRAAKSLGLTRGFVAWQKW